MPNKLHGFGADQAKLGVAGFPFRVCLRLPKSVFFFFSLTRDFDLPIRIHGDGIAAQTASSFTAHCSALQLWGNGGHIWADWLTGGGVCLELCSEPAMVDKHTQHSSSRLASAPPCVAAPSLSHSPFWLREPLPDASTAGWFGGQTVVGQDGLAILVPRDLRPGQ